MGRERVRAHDRASTQAADARRAAEADAAIAAGNRSLARALGPNGGSVPPMVAAEIHGRRGKGQRLPASAAALSDPDATADVRVHHDRPADRLSRTLGARAFTTGTDIFFASGQYSPDSADGRELLSHELTHVSQQSPTAAPGALRVAPRHSPAETEARRASPADRASGRRALSGVIHRDEAPGHHEMEETAAAGTDSQLVMEMYAGNWMRDYSQINTPRLHTALAETVPRRLDDPGGPTIGRLGAEDIITSVIRALAYQKFGPEITDRLIVPENIGVYTPEQHMDHSMGTSAADHLVRDSTTGELRPGRVQTQSDGLSTTFVPDPDRDAQLAGRAFPGLQVENPELFRVGDAGLVNQLHNSIEWVKDTLFDAYQAGPTPDGRMHLGSALHGVEDYLAHSNFVEVALNQWIHAAAEQHTGLPGSPGEELAARLPAGSLTVLENPVDTLFDAQTDWGAPAITTGTASALDLAVSVGQILLPQLPGLARMIDGKIDEMLYLAIEDPENATWDTIKEKLTAGGESGEGLAVVEVLEALDRHIEIPVKNAWLTGYDIPFTDRFVPTGIHITETRHRGIVQGIRDYLDLYQRIRKRIEELETALDIATLGLTWVIDEILDVKQHLLDMFHGWIREVVDNAKHQVATALLAMANEITGRDLQSDKKMGLIEAADTLAMLGLEDVRERTSMESQLPDVIASERGQDAEYMWSVYGVADGEAQLPLPPSHSEISKDHAPHDDVADDADLYQKASGGADRLQGHDHAGEALDARGGSLFFEIHRLMGIEADIHIMSAMQDAWDEQSQANTVDAIRTADARHDEEDILTEARTVQAQAQIRAEAEGRRFSTYAEHGQKVSDLMALVDYFVSHPDESSWWQSIVSDYVAEHTDEVLAHIRTRNETRARRH